MYYFFSEAVPGALLVLSASFIHNPLVISVILGILAGVFTDRTIPLATAIFIKSGRHGKDLLKKDQPIIAESIGAVVGVAYFVAMFLFIPVPFLDWFIRDTYSNSSDHRPFPHDRLAQFLGGLLALFSMLFLGFADDVLDIRWRVKIWFPFIASMPLLMVYIITYGKTDVLIPIPLRFFFPTETIHLALTVFSTNSINIMAGINGIEGVQSLIIAISLSINDLLQLYINPARTEAHLNSLYFLIPFIGVTVGYLRHNWYPAKAFGGDTYAYFAGMIFAVVGALSNLSKTVLLFMTPQIFNFLYSCPQLFHFVDCPRHRMPEFDVKTGMVKSRRFSLKNSKFLGRLMVRFLEMVGLADIRRDPSGAMLDCNNLTIMSIILVRFGPMSERNLAVCVVLVQVISSLIAFTIRYGLVHIVYN
ncbi:hypothetical protein BASA62_004584 [Batrachochytrium salamandrivorans]|nr:hypothetical protein BASA62_004584 [Batrachochytrium salamandrivorans]